MKAANKGTRGRQQNKPKEDEITEEEQEVINASELSEIERNVAR